MDWRWHLSAACVKLAIWLLKFSGWYAGYWNHWTTMFDYAERRGLHILPSHYYSPIPTTRILSADLWTHDRTPIGFELNVDRSSEYLNVLSRRYGGEYNSFPKKRGRDPHTYYLDNDAFLPGDAEVLYAIVRDLKPRRIVEIGSGYSTLLICQAIRANQKESPERRCEFIAIEPYPPAFLNPLPGEVTRIEAKPIQEVNLSLFSSLQENDVLFIDSTHVARIGSDVVHECLAILPSLSPGVIVHIHDIFIPAEYPRLWIDQSRLFWNEQYLLEAFLTFNCEYEVIMPVHAIWRRNPKLFFEAIPSATSCRMAPSSFWMRRRRSI